MRGAIIFFRLIFTAIFLLLFVFTESPSAKAQGDQIAEIGNLNDLKVNIEVKNDSSLVVVEEFAGLSLYSSSFVWNVDSKNVRELEIEENGTKIDSSQIDIQGGDMARLTFPLNYYSNTNLKISYKSFNNLMIVNKKILFKNIIFDRPGIFINNLQVNVKLPNNATEAAEGQRFYAVHGIEDSSQTTEGENVLVYNAFQTSSYSSFTVEDTFLSNSIVFPLGDRIKFFFDNLSLVSLIIISLPLPLITLIMLLYLHLRYKNSVRINRGLPISSELPDEIPPALLDLLYQGDITQIGVSATILDLIKKGVVIIVDKGDMITFGRKDTNIQLLPYEEKILGELFKRQKIKTSLGELEKIEEKELVDPIFEKVYHEIYQIGSLKGFFERDPYRMKIMHHLIGIALFLLSIVLYVLAIVFFPANPLMLLPPFGITVASILILYLAKIIPPRTPAGKSELERWLSFKKYLLGHYPIEDGKNLSLKYLPQAEALGATEEWIGHFKNLPAETPSFYVSAMPYVGTCEWMVRTVNACRGMAEEIEELKGY
ncbi:MAG: DUF2207 domain-containing protein [Candidatus Berkelbacteria bacterium]|nr:DUF2207 domain-containing protein [Candidatus Berkelbacteria bacterium]